MREDAGLSLERCDIRFEREFDDTDAPERDLAAQAGAGATCLIEGTWIQAGPPGYQP
jgi:hypothetical protein